MQILIQLDAERYRCSELAFNVTIYLCKKLDIKLPNSGKNESSRTHKNMCTCHSYDVDPQFDQTTVRAQGYSAYQGADE